MKKVLLLALGLFVAGLAAWAVPREPASVLPKVKIDLPVSVIDIPVELMAITSVNVDVQYFGANDDAVIPMAFPVIPALDERWCRQFYGSPNHIPLSRMPVRRIEPYSRT